MSDNTVPEHGALENRLRTLRKRRSWLGLIRSLILTGAAVYLLFGVVFGIAVVRGDSMTPAVKEGDAALFLRVGNHYRAGDIVLVRAEERAEYVKRIVALPGQTVEMEGGELVIDGEPLAEPYIYEGTYGKDGEDYPLTLGEKEYFVLGDHRENSKDSRNYGPVAEDSLDGKILLIFRWQG